MLQFPGWVPGWIEVLLTEAEKTKEEMETDARTWDDSPLTTCRQSWIHLLVQPGFSWLSRDCLEKENTLSSLSATDSGSVQEGILVLLWVSRTACSPAMVFYTDWSLIPRG